MSRYEYDIYGWLVGPTESLYGRTTDIIPPEEDAIHKANFDGIQWRLLDKSVYMQARYPELATPMLVITSCTVDDDHAAYKYIDLNHGDGEITIQAGSLLTVNFQVQCFGAPVEQNAHWRVPIQPVDSFNQPSGPTRLVIASMENGIGSVVYQTRTGQSEKLVINEAVVNSGLKSGKLLMPQPLYVYIME